MVRVWVRFAFCSRVSLRVRVRVRVRVRRILNISGLELGLLGRTVDNTERWCAFRVHSRVH